MKTKFKTSNNVLGNSRKSGFTLLEVMVSLVIAVSAMGLVWMSFTSIAQATARGEKMLESLHHGEYAMTQLVSAMRSAVFFNNTPKQYEFLLENEGGRDAKDIVSWVTSSAAFMPVGSPLANSLHRIYVSIEEDDDGNSGLAVVAYPYMLDPEDDDVEEVEFWIVSKNIRGLDCWVYDQEKDSWEDEWDFEKSIPRFVQFTLIMDPAEEDGDPLEMSRIITVPMGILAKKQAQYKDMEEPVEGEE